MQADTDMTRLAVERAGEARRQTPAARSVQDRCNGPAFDKRKLRRDAGAACDQSAVSIDTVVVAGVWLAFYVVAAVHSLAFGN
jgi:hypothetical protein